MFSIGVLARVNPFCAQLASSQGTSSDDASTFAFADDFAVVFLVAVFLVAVFFAAGFFAYRAVALLPNLIENEDGMNPHACWSS